jgi:hypothetical protein
MGRGGNNQLNNNLLYGEIAVPRNHQKNKWQEQIVLSKETLISKKDDGIFLGKNYPKNHIIHNYCGTSTWLIMTDKLPFLEDDFVESTSEEHDMMMVTQESTLKQSQSDSLKQTISSEDFVLSEDFASKAPIIKINVTNRDSQQVMLYANGAEIAATEKMFTDYNGQWKYDLAVDELFFYIPNNKQAVASVWTNKSPEFLIDF